MKKKIKKSVLMGLISIPIVLGLGMTAQANDNFFSSFLNGAGEELGNQVGGFFQGAFTAVTGFESPQAFADDIFSDILGEQQLDLPVTEDIAGHVGELGSVDLKGVSEASQGDLAEQIVNSTGINVNRATKAQELALQRGAITASAQNTLSQEAQTAAKQSIDNTTETNAQQAGALPTVMDFTVTQDIVKYQAILDQRQNEILGDIKAGQITAAQRDAQANQLLSNIDGSLEEIKNQGNSSEAALAVLGTSKSRLGPM